MENSPEASRNAKDSDPLFCFVFLPSFPLHFLSSFRKLRKKKARKRGKTRVDVLKPPHHTAGGGDSSVERNTPPLCTDPTVSHSSLNRISSGHTVTSSGHPRPGTLQNTECSGQTRRAGLHACSFHSGVAGWRPPRAVPSEGPYGHVQSLS